ADVGRAFGQSAQQVAVPVPAVGDVDPHPLPGGGQPELLVGAGAVDHLQLVALPVAAVPGGQGAGDADQPRVVRGDHRVGLARHQGAQAADVGGVHVAAGGVGALRIGGVGPLDQADPDPLRGEGAHVVLGAAQVALDG